MAESDGQFKQIRIKEGHKFQSRSKRCSYIRYIRPEALELRRKEQEFIDQ